MNHTTYYQLSLWEKDDLIQMEDFNDNNAKIDTALKAHDTAIGTKANSATVGALTTRVGALESGKADASALSAEISARESAVSAEKNARESADSALQGSLDAEAATRAAAVNAINADLGSHGKNLRIATGSYVGNGTSGKNNPTSLSFDFKPMMIFISSAQGSSLGNGWMMRPFTLGVPACAPAGVGTAMIQVEWSERGVSWYTLSSSNPHLLQSNTNGYTYQYLALGYDE